MIELIYFSVYMFLISTKIGILLFCGILVFFMPLVGFHYIGDMFESSFFIEFIVAPFFTVSLIMFILGFIAKKKFKI